MNSKTVTILILISSLAKLHGASVEDKLKTYGTLSTSDNLPLRPPSSPILNWQSAETSYQNDTEIDLNELNGYDLDVIENRSIFLLDGMTIVFKWSYLHVLDRLQS